MINFTTFQIRIFKFYILPIFLITFLLSLIINFNFLKYFRDGVEFYEQTKTIKEIQRKNIILNDVKLTKWTTLTENQKEYLLNNDKDKLNDEDKFKIKYKNEKVKSIINDENIEDNYNLVIYIKTMFQSFFFSIFSLILLFILPRFRLYKFYKDYYIKKLKPLENFINLPFYLASLTSTLNNQDKKNIVDVFIKYDELNQCYYYKTNSITQKNIYENNLLDIENYLKLENLKIYQENLIIKIQSKKIKKFLEFNKNDYLDKKLYLGETENNKKIYLDLQQLKHTIIVGQSGSGKSVFLQNLLVSIFKNIKYYEKIYLVDFKMVEMNRYENKHHKIQVIDDINVCVEILKEIHHKMRERLKRMKLKGLQECEEEKILVFFDEFRTLKNNNLDKDDLKLMNKILIDIIQKSRRRGIYLIFRGQKRDTTNIDSNILGNIMNKILLKTSSNDNITKVRGNSDELERNGLSLNEIKNFNRGRLYYKDELDGDKYLIQSPFFNLQDKEQNDFMFSFLKDDSNLNEQKHTLNERKEENEETQREEIENDFKPLENDLKTLIEMIEKEYSEKWGNLKNLEIEEQKTKKSKLLNIKKRFNILRNTENIEDLKTLKEKLKEI